MKKRNILKTGIVILITAVLLSSTSAVSLSNVKAVEKSVEENEENSKISTEETYVDPNLHLTKKDLSWLIRSILFIKNEDYRELTIKIIKILITKGAVNSEQIEQIISNSDYEITAVYPFCSILSKNSEGSGDCFPGFIRVRLCFPFTSKGGFLSWETYDDTDRYGIYVNLAGITYTTPHQGTAIGYVGYVQNTMHIQYLCNTMDLDGIALLVYVTIK